MIDRTSYLHLFGTGLSYEDSKEFGRALVKLVHKQLPNFTIKNAPDRVQEQGDVFKNVLKEGVDIQKTRTRRLELF